jgi:hypothetical protein
MKTANSNKWPHAGSPEWKLLIATASLQIDADRKAEITCLVKMDIDWDTLISQSMMHGTSGLLFRHLSALQPDAGVPKEVLERLYDFYLNITASNLQQMAAFQKAADAFAEVDVDLILLKGAALAESLYGDIGLRPMSDVDLIIREDDWPKVCKVLKSLNYHSVGQEFATLPPKLTRYDIQSHVQCVSPMETCLEFQFDLFTMGIGMLDMDGVWERSREVVISGRAVRVPGPEDQLLHLLIHANRHGCSRLKWLVDIAEYLRQCEDIDWNLLEMIARREKVGAVIYMTIRHIEHLLGIDLVPRAVLEHMKPQALQRMVWNYLWPEEQISEFNGRYEDGICYYFYRPFSGWNVLNFVLVGRVRDKMAYQARWIAPSFNWMAETYGQPKSLKLLKYYPKRLGSRSRKNIKNH